MRLPPVLCLTVALAACGTLPDIPEPYKAVEARAGYPDFVPITQITGGQAEIEARARQTEDTVAARVSGLRARAARLRSTELE